MISNQWYVIMESREVRKDQVVGVTRFGEKLVAWRDHEGKLGLFRDRCPHRGIELSKGRVKESHLQCPFHGFEYDISGKCTLIPANGRSSAVPTYIRANALTVREAHGFVYAWYTEETDQGTSSADKNLEKVFPELPWFDNLDDSLICSGFTDDWNAHYSRAIENQLDVVHVPFIHRTTIGRGIGPVVNGPFTRSGENFIQFWPFNEDDHGQKPLKPDQISDPVSKSTFIHFIFPNLWQNHIMDSMRIVVAFAPIDDNHTRFYLRTYQKMIRIPLLKDVYFLFARLFNRIVLHQDRRVVETHQPQATSLKMDEHLIPGDYPVILYRKMRERMKEGK
jgi:phenylpropionate dioxygenase-like ring-hydroxylating dioxygenase large terminal subunit